MWIEWTFSPPRLTTNKVFWRCTEPKTSQEIQHKLYPSCWEPISNKNKHTNHKALISKHQAQIKSTVPTRTFLTEHTIYFPCRCTRWRSKQPIIQFLHDRGSDVFIFHHVYSMRNSQSTHEKRSPRLHQLTEVTTMLQAANHARKMVQVERVCENNAMKGFVSTHR